MLPNNNETNENTVPTIENNEPAKKRKLLSAIAGIALMLGIGGGVAAHKADQEKRFPPNYRPIPQQEPYVTAPTSVEVPADTINPPAEQPQAEELKVPYVTAPNQVVAPTDKK